MLLAFVKSVFRAPLLHNLASVPSQSSKFQYVSSTHVTYPHAAEVLVSDGHFTWFWCVLYERYPLSVR